MSSVIGDLPPGAQLRAVVEAENPLQVVGVINAYCALLAQRAGFKALYLSGAGVANASFGWPDLGITKLAHVLEDVRRITGATKLPLLVDADTGWPSHDGPGTTTATLIEAGAAGLHLEDQIETKRCGHLSGKVLIHASQMVDRIQEATNARTDSSFVIMARTDAANVESLDTAIDRANQYAQAGADMIFAEALENLQEYRRFCKSVDVPVLANMTEFGRTPLFTLEELHDAGVRLALYPLSAFRAMNRAANDVYQAIRYAGTQKQVVHCMQSRNELYQLLDYETHERQIDEQLKIKKNRGQ